MPLIALPTRAAAPQLPRLSICIRDGLEAGLGNPGALPCRSCQGARLQGAGDAPPLAGRPPSYIVRQLYDIQYGYWRGPAVAPMEPEVAHLTSWDRIAIAAYIVSLWRGVR
jgi:cytochrome c553